MTSDFLIIYDFLLLNPPIRVVLCDKVLSLPAGVTGWLAHCCTYWDAYQVTRVSCVTLESSKRTHDGGPAGLEIMDTTEYGKSPIYERFLFESAFVKSSLVIGPKC